MVQMSIRLPARRDRRPAPGLAGPARVDRRTKDLTKRLRPGDIAVIDHEDLDRVSAEALVACRPAAVVNAASSISGRYPNLGPEILVAAGIPLLDRAGPGVMELRDGTSVREVGKLRNRVAAKGANQTAELAVLRSGKSRTVKVKLGELPDKQTAEQQMQQQLRNRVP